MSILENLLAALEANTAALNAHTAALKGSSVSAASAGGAEPEGKPAATTKPAKGGKAAAADKPAAPKNTVEQVKAAAVLVKEKFGSAAAKELIKEVGKAAELKDIKPENYDAFVEACEKKVNATEDESAEDEDDL